MTPMCTAGALILMDTDIVMIPTAQILSWWSALSLPPVVVVNDIFRQRRTDSYICSALFSVTTVNYYST